MATENKHEDFFTENEPNPSETAEVLTEVASPSPKKKSLKKAKSTYLAFVLALCLFCSVLGGAVGVLIGVKISDASLSFEGIARRLSANSGVSLPSGRIADVAAAVQNTIVTVYAQYEQGTIASVSSGVVMYREGKHSYIVTCAHGVVGYRHIAIRTYEGQDISAELVASDTKSDIALLSVENNTLPVANPTTTKPVMGESVLALGNPVGNIGICASFGIVSREQVTMEVGGTPQELIKVDMAVNPGNSGGGVFNMEGELIGIVSAKISEADGTKVEGVAFAIPFSVVYDITGKLRENGHVVGRPCLGIDLSLPVASSSRLIVSDSFADHKEGELMAGDMIINIKTESTSKDFTSELTYAQALAKLHQVISGCEEGDVVMLTVERDGAVKRIKLVVHLTDANTPKIDV
ncbi:MAG: trypsin-like peptidase domain-containing protein [Clostridia bacterium]|nr:trypsin-like peptidase domain-containing protein [Clostridia bacterium]